MVEKVVNAPQKPVPNRGLIYVVGGQISSTKIISRARMKDPATLMPKVVAGNVPCAVGKARPSSYRATPPANPPSAITASTRGGGAARRGGESGPGSGNADVIGARSSYSSLHHRRCLVRVGTVGRVAATVDGEPHHRCGH